MKHERIGPARDGEAGELFTPADTPAVTTNKSKKQPTAKAGTTVLPQRVTGLGLAAILAKPGCEPPSVVVERRATRAFVFISSPPWGFGDRRQEFLNPGSEAIDAYAVKLGKELLRVAQAERDRRQRIRALQQAEREAMRRGRT